MQVGLFGSIGEQLGRELEVDAARIGDIAGLRRLLASLYPDAAKIFGGSSLKACIGDRMVADGHRLDGVERVEFFPPLSGG